MFDNTILKILMDRYGHIEDIGQSEAAMREDGLGDVLDLLNDNRELIDLFVEEHKEDIEQSLRHYTGSGTIPMQEPVQGLPLSNYDTFKFDPRACLADCDGKCCKGRNYVMISYFDIFKLLTSPAAHHLKIHSTRDLFEHEPPFIESFFNQEYELYLPYLRFLAVGPDPNTPPEHAENNICPFLYPIVEVFSFHNLQIPPDTNKNAMGCILMDCKPLICRLSPIGQSRGMITGRLSYEYIEPSKDCPGCATDAEIPLSSYTSALIPPSEDQERALFHTMLMAHNARCEEGRDQKHFNSVLLEFYNIDRLLSLYGHTPKRRPKYAQVMEILTAAAKGDFAPYDQFIQSLNVRSFE